MKREEATRGKGHIKWSVVASQIEGRNIKQVRPVAILWSQQDVLALARVLYHPAANAVMGSLLLLWQVKERWSNYLDPNVRKDDFTPEEGKCRRPTTSSPHKSVYWIFVVMTIALFCLSTLLSHPAPQMRSWLPKKRLGWDGPPSRSCSRREWPIS